MIQSSGSCHCSRSIPMMRIVRLSSALKQQQQQQYRLLSLSWNYYHSHRLLSFLPQYDPMLSTNRNDPNGMMRRCMIHSSTSTSDDQRRDQLSKTIGHNFPDFIDFWDRETFRHVGYGLNVVTLTALIIPTTTAYTTMMFYPISWIPAVMMSIMTSLYWKIGNDDIQQTSHALLRNYPVLAHVRYIFETIRPEIRQYFIEGDMEGRPYHRQHRSQIYQRAKDVDDTIPFGTRRNVYEVRYEWACHSMWPKVVAHDNDHATRYMIGTTQFGTTKPYHASVFNISGMSYGAISDHAILALNRGAKHGNFYHNTGEGGVSSFHLQGGGDIVWNIGTGYFGCGTGEGQHRIFEPFIMQDVIQQSDGRIKMIEIKLSQGAKPGHGGLLPKAKITAEIAAARKLPYPPLGDCHSPSQHSAFSNAHELIQFIAKVRELADGIPVGIKLCVGNPYEIASLIKAIIDIGTGPDFITVDGGEGGTGAAPPEFSNSIGIPLEEGLITVRNMLIGANLKDHIAINASGHVATGFAIVRTLALGADITSAARAFMLSLGCIQALKCNTNHCPTGIATLDKRLMFGLDPTEKSIRVANYHRKTIEAASGIVGAIGKTSFTEISSDDIMRRVTDQQVQTLREQFPLPEPGSLLHGSAPKKLQHLWNTCDQRNVLSSSSSSSSSTYPTTWIY